MAAAPIPPTPVASVDSESPHLSEGARIVDTFIAPSKTFTDLRRNASWWAPWLLISIFSLAFVFVMNKQIGFEQISKNAIAQSSRAEQFEKLPPEQQAKQIQVSDHRCPLHLLQSSRAQLDYFRDHRGGAHGHLQLRGRC